MSKANLNFDKTNEELLAFLDESTIAANLFGILREFDDDQVDYIYSESFDTAGIGSAIMNRLLKAAGHHIEKLV